MSKKEVIWLLIRIAGVYFLWLGVESLVTLISNYVVASGSPELLSRSARVFLQSVLLIGLHFSLGLYMLVNGSLLFRGLDQQPIPWREDR
jgi:hypothetical protein